MNFAILVFIAFLLCVSWSLVKSEWRGNFKDYEDKDEDEHHKPDNWGSQ